MNPNDLLIELSLSQQYLWPILVVVALRQDDRGFLEDIDRDLLQPILTSVWILSNHGPTIGQLLLAWQQLREYLVDKCQHQKEIDEAIIIKLLLTSTISSFV